MRDDEFIRGKVPMTKEEIRTISLKKLQIPVAGKLLDVGAGTGSIGLQALIEDSTLRVTGIEQKEIGIELINQNIKKFHLENYLVIQGKAPLELTERFDGVFIGGSGGNLKEIIKWALELLKNEGHLVMNFILLENALLAIKTLEEQAVTELDIVQVQVSNWQQLGSGHYFKPENPTIIISCQKNSEKQAEGR